MRLGAEAVGVLGIAGVVLGVVATVLAVVALVGQRRVRAAYRVFAGGDGARPGDDVLELLRRHVEQVAALRDDVRATRRYGDELRGLVAGCVSRVATVRYDAFDDMGGRLSFSAALLDEHGDGVVVTSINGRSETRTYAKPVHGGDSRHNLSDEESQAIRQALSGPARGEQEVRTRRPGARVVRDAS